MPISYNYLLQGALYHSLHKELAAFLHEKGYTDGKRSFKLFSFSLLQGVYQLDRVKKNIAFDGEIKLTISSPMQDFCHSLVNILLATGNMRLGTQATEIEKINVRQLKVTGDQAVVKTLSPAVLYSTLLRPDGRKYTVYFQPGEADYGRLFSENLQKKYRAFWGTDAPAGNVTAKALGLPRLKVVNYKDIIIKGYAGKLLVTGPQELLQLAVDGGIGSKNSQGFGCVELQ
ncbi:CRISPR-associated endoribonuclease Cas6 [Sporomusa termitida]|uniref:CRISPR-associated endoribonuclease Cas6 n=1 Tax=Sporomusa termitida TaxID=2377 RepID=UPI001B87BE75|nr:CRISPR-associated endoribonuclease Cas6 [Sporomusa termitida]